MVLGGIPYSSIFSDNKSHICWRVQSVSSCFPHSWCSSTGCSTNFHAINPHQSHHFPIKTQRAPQPLPPARRSAPSQRRRRPGHQGANGKCPEKRFYYCSNRKKWMDGWMDGLTDWLMDWLIDGLIDGLIDWLGKNGFLFVLLLKKNGWPLTLNIEL